MNDQANKQRNKSLSNNPTPPCNHIEEIKKLEDLKAKEKTHYENHITKQESLIEKLTKDIKKQHDQIDQALKIHRANEKMKREIE